MRKLIDSLIKFNHMIIRHWTGWMCLEHFSGLCWMLKTKQNCWYTSTVCGGHLVWQRATTDFVWQILSRSMGIAGKVWNTKSKDRERERVLLFIPAIWRSDSKVCVHGQTSVSFPSLSLCEGGCWGTSGLWASNQSIWLACKEDPNKLSCASWKKGLYGCGI